MGGEIGGGIIIAQGIVLIVVILFFFLGVWVSGRLKGDTPLGLWNLVAFCIAAFLLLGLPLSPAVFNALIETNNDLFMMLSALVPPFFAGLTSRTELRRILEGNRELRKSRNYTD
ncbi:hypothetical protein [Pseudoruegeria sp. HB172150]|uniref:hypothetical protein n=1 Tax=Pseudoruegeria sp. HB172150 TaxID=2721164 RepID=UPI00155413C2|nr:hypothetical protein [Pseudoruegeria sp. HB172150]